MVGQQWLGLQLRQHRVQIPSRHVLHPHEEYLGVLQDICNKNDTECVDLLCALPRKTRSGLRHGSHRLLDFELDIVDTPVLKEVYLLAICNVLDDAASSMNSYFVSISTYFSNR